MCVAQTDTKDPKTVPLGSGLADNAKLAILSRQARIRQIEDQALGIVPRDEEARRARAEGR